MIKLLELFLGLVELLWNVILVALDTVVGFIIAITTIGLPAAIVAALLCAFAIRIVMHFF